MPGFRGPYQLRDLLQILGVLDRAAPALRHQVSQQLRHLLVELRVHRCFVDDQLPDVVLDRLGNILTLPLGRRRKIILGLGPFALDQVNQADVIQVRDDLKSSALM